jgi:hypothetical protein
MKFVLHGMHIANFYNANLHVDASWGTLMFIEIYTKGSAYRIYKPFHDVRICIDTRYGSFALSEPMVIFYDTEHITFGCHCKDENDIMYIWRTFYKSLVNKNA